VARRGQPSVTGLGYQRLLHLRPRRALASYASTPCTNALIADVSRHQFIPGALNGMADDASRLWHLTDSQFLTHFNTHYPQNMSWRLQHLTPSMSSALTGALFKRRCVPAALLNAPVPRIPHGASGRPFVPHLASMPDSRASTETRYLFSCSSPTATSMAPSLPATTPWTISDCGGRRTKRGAGVRPGGGPRPSPKRLWRSRHPPPLPLSSMDEGRCPAHARQAAPHFSCSWGGSTGARSQYPGQPCGGGLPHHRFLLPSAPRRIRWHTSHCGQRPLSLPRRGHVDRRPQIGHDHLSYRRSAGGHLCHFDLHHRKNSVPGQPSATPVRPPNPLSRPLPRFPAPVPASRRRWATTPLNATRPSPTAVSWRYLQSAAITAFIRAAVRLSPDLGIRPTARLCSVNRRWRRHGPHVRGGRLRPHPPHRPVALRRSLPIPPRPSATGHEWHCCRHVPWRQLPTHARCAPHPSGDTRLALPPHPCLAYGPTGQTWGTSKVLPLGCRNKRNLLQ
jgi:hypothetical protein